MAERPNVLLVTADHWFGSLLGCAGHETILTPTLDTLARSGMRFTQAYAECPICIPARRSLMTGTSPRTHGDRVYTERLAMPDPQRYPTLAETFGAAGYQTFAVGKLHVYPQRSRIGFDEVILDEEGRMQFGATDDYEMFLADRGHAGEQFGHGMGNNNYETRPWHLGEELHPTTWATRQMARMIQRRDPTRPAFWYLSYRHPHPPLTPLWEYLEMYREAELPPPVVGEWAKEIDALPRLCRQRARKHAHFAPRQIELTRRAFYALCTHLDHQLRVVLGTLREQGLLDNTIICFSSDHGDMLGRHRLWGKHLMYQESANVPMILLGVRGDRRVAAGGTDDRLTAWRDVMPTLLDLAGVEVPRSVEGLSMVGPRRREYLYGEIGEGASATRMIHDGRFKLIYYAAGNRFQLFDLREDQGEMHDLSASPGHREKLERLTAQLRGELYGEDVNWVREGKWVGLPDPGEALEDNRGLDAQRGMHFPAPPGRA